MTNKRKIKYTRGFTLVETLMAVLVLMIAIAGPLTIVSKSLQATTISKDQDTALYLAQDAVEYVRWVRDSNCLTAGAQTGGCPTGVWLEGLNGTANGHTQTNTPSTPPGNCVSATGGQACLVDSLKDYVTSCSAVPCSTPLYYDSTNNYFLTTSSNGTDTVAPTIFTRTVQIQTPVSGNAGEASTTVTVSWNDPLLHTVLVHEDIFNWQ